MHSRQHANAENFPAALSVSRDRSRGCVGTLVAALIGFVFGFSFLIAGVLVIWVMALWPALQVARASVWTEVPCTIVSSKVIGSQDGDTFAVAIEYEYEINQRLLQGDQYSFFGRRTSGRDGKQKVVDQFPPGTRSSCFVNPHDVTESVFDRGFQWQILYGLIGVPFAAVGAFFLYAFLKAKSRRKKVLLGEDDDEFDDARVSAVTPVVTSKHEFSDDGLREEPGPLVLTEETSAQEAFWGLLLFSVIWNAFVFVFYLSAFPAVFLGLLGLVGLVIIGATIRSLMKVFNPRPVLTLSRTLIPLGGAADLFWTFEGNTNSLQQLKIELDAIEQVKYRQGTDTKIEESSFFREVLVDTTELTEIREGSVTVTIPTESMHTFTGTNNKILWRIIFTGRIAHWPDIHSRFGFRVVPHE